MDSFVRLNVPPTAQRVRLLSLKRRWGIYYRSTRGDTEGRVELRPIDVDMLRGDHVDPTDVDAVVAHVERRLQAEGLRTTRRAAEGRSVVASWDIAPGPVF
ncbi:MAG TPA: hypothetical protein VN768_02120 [Acidimicrobiales bacterium]|nr:hypothetical protein [Acidimicrobiales bacterium]